MKTSIIKGSILFILFLVVLLSVLLLYQPFKNKLPVYNPTDVNTDLVDASLQSSTESHIVSDFELINQNGRTITQDDYKAKIYVADFFFTSCSTICPIMTNNMVKIQNEFLNDDDIMLLSLSVTPTIDSIPKLREYAYDKGVIDSKWNITTGDKKHIYKLARKSYFATTDEGDGGLQDFIHTSNFILVDKKKQIRGIYNGLDNKEILRLIADIKILNN